MTVVDDVEMINRQLRIRIVIGTSKEGIEMTAKHYTFNAYV